MILIESVGYRTREYDHVKENLDDGRRVVEFGEFGTRVRGDTHAFEEDGARNFKLKTRDPKGVHSPRASQLPA